MPDPVQALSATPLPTRIPVSKTHPAVPAILSALSLWFAYPPADRGYLAWIALVPFFLLIKSDRRPFPLYFGAWIGGMVFGLTALSWIASADVWGMIWMALFMSVWWPIVLFLARLGHLRLRLPLMLAAPIVWVAIEYVRAHLLSGFPWYYLAHSQYLWLPMIQMSDLVGAWGLSFLMAMVNAWWVELLTLPLVRTTPRGIRLTRAQTIRAITVVVLIGSALGYGFARMRTAAFRDGPKLALIQTDFPQALRNSTRYEEIMGTTLGLIRRATSKDDAIDLIVWPETSYPPGFVEREPGVSDEAFERGARALDPESKPEEWTQRGEVSAGETRRWVDQLRIPMLIGAVHYRFGQEKASKYNAAVLVEPGLGATQRYFKQVLVPFGEYIPFLQTMPFLLSLTPYPDGYIPSLTPGGGSVWFDIKGTRYFSAICFEDTVPHLVADAFEGEGRHPAPDVLLNLSNDGWFRGTAEHRTHLAIAVFRAVENRVPVARSVNTGESAVIDGNGFIRATIAPGKADFLTQIVPLDDRSGFYSRTRDAFPLGCLAITLGFLVIAPFRGRNSVKVDDVPTEKPSPTP